MTCPDCDQVMHMDSNGVCSCIACGFRDSQNPEIKVNDAGENTSVSINDTLEERGNRYGAFDSHAILSRQLRSTMFSAISANGNLDSVTPYMEESMIMICHKLARIANGDPTYDDNWRDIAGYAQLVVDILQKEKR